MKEKLANVVKQPPKNIQKKKFKMIVEKSVKAALMTAVAVAIANSLGLLYPATAGIITLLTIQNTKRETLATARNKGLAFIITLILSFCVFQLFGFTILAYMIYLLIFMLLCLLVGWGDAISVSVVLVSHFLWEGNMGMELLLNEILIFLIGVTLGVIVNLNLTKKGQEFERVAGEVDAQIKYVIHRMAVWLPKENKVEYDAHCFEKLNELLEEAELVAANNFKNTVFRSDMYELDYVQMREKQAVVLREIYRNIKKIAYFPVQAQHVTELLGHIEAQYHKYNTAEELMEELGGLFTELRGTELPKNREEFEARAILFYILMQIQDLLELKREFVLTHGNRENK